MNVFPNLFISSLILLLIINKLILNSVLVGRNENADLYYFKEANAGQI